MQRTPEKTSDMIAAIRTLLDAGKLNEAAAQLRAFGTMSNELNNAYGVILMWSGETAKAVELFRHLVMAGGGVSLRADAPMLYKTNFAAALLLGGNIAGCTGVLDEVNQEQNAGVIRLRTAIRNWRQSLPLLSRIWYSLSGEAPKKPVHLDFSPSELLTDAGMRTAAA